MSELGDPVRAWGFFVTNRDARSPREAIGSGGQVLPRKATFAKGRYYVEIAASPDKDHRGALRAFVEAMLPRVPGEAHVPAAVAHFPTDGLDTESVRLVPESVLGLRVLKTRLRRAVPGRPRVDRPRDGRGRGDGDAREAARALPEAAPPVAGLGDEAHRRPGPVPGRPRALPQGRARGRGRERPRRPGRLPLAKALAARLP